jgi:signal transduction histidine kinase
MDRHVIANSGQAWELVAAILLAAVGLGLYAWWRADPESVRRGRIRQVAWCVALLAAVGILTASVYSAVSRNVFGWWPVVLIATVVLVLLRPGLSPRILPVILIGLGLLGFGVAHQIFTNGWAAAGLTGSTGSGDWYGLTHVGVGLQQDGDELILPQAYLFLVLGGWLGWRELKDHPAAARLLLGRTAAAQVPGRPWCLLLVPLVLAASMLAANWAAVAIPLLIAAGIVIWYWPRLAGQMAALGLVAFAAFGLVSAQNFHLNGAYVAPASATAPARDLKLSAAPSSAGGQAKVVPASVQPAKPAPGKAGTPGAGFDSGVRPVLFGLVAVKGESTMYAAYIEGLLLICFSCWLVPQTFPGVARLLGLSPDAALARRVQRLTESRAVAVDTAAADLRRLERDLHDGAQARLVALGMNLRAAERLIHTSPDAAAALVAEARDASARALTELRELVRGVHPPVLADRGLADAIRALALDSPLHVQTEIDLPGRPPAPVETACYFAVAELLTNAAKHSGARQAAVAARHADGRLRIEVTDFGLGGADASRGSGLAGVEKRLASFDGILAISSPVGGPTIVVLEVPCALSSPKVSSA